MTAADAQLVVGILGGIAAGFITGTCVAFLARRVLDRKRANLWPHQRPSQSTIMRDTAGNTWTSDLCTHCEGHGRLRTRGGAEVLCLACVGAGKSLTRKVSQPLSEGGIKRAGVNPPPARPKPDLSPPPQGARPRPPRLSSPAPSCMPVYVPCMLASSDGPSGTSSSSSDSGSADSSASSGSSDSGSSSGD